MVYIGEDAFNRSGLTSIVIPDSVEVIGDRAFYDCNLESVVIGNSVARIGDKAFQGSYNLESVTIPASVREIGEDAFYDCAVISIVFSGSMPRLGGLCALGENLETIKVPAMYVEEYQRCLPGEFHDIIEGVPEEKK